MVCNLYFYNRNQEDKNLRRKSIISMKKWNFRVCVPFFLFISPRFYHCFLYSRKKNMMLKYGFILSLFLLSLISQAQERYKEVLFDEVSVETLTYATKDGEDLELDIYVPQADAEEERATIIFVHGGGFSTGIRDGNNIKEFCNLMASYGYVAASLSYRLTRKGTPETFGCNCPTAEKLKTFEAAVEDVQDATFFLIENRQQFGIDPQKIILAGSSAGAETVLQTAYQPPYCYGLDSGPVSFAGVISIAGAIPDTSIIYDESAVPSMFIHGTDDNLVPYGTAPHHFCDKNSPGYMILHGAQTMAQKLDQLDVPYWLYTVCGADHSLTGQPITNFKDEIVEFCHDFVIEGKGETRHTIKKGPQKGGMFEIFNFCSE